MFHSICIISPDYPGNDGVGAIGSDELLAYGLARHGIAVHVVAPANDGRARRTLQHGVTVHRLGRPPVGRGATSAPVAWSELLATFYAQLDAAVRFDVVLAGEVDAEMLVPVAHPHTAVVGRLDDGHAADAGERHGVGRGDSPAAPPPAQRRATGLIASSRALAESAGADTACPAAVLPRVFVIDAPGPTREPDPETIELVSIVSRGPQTRQDLALHCLAHLRRAGLRAHLTIVGADAPTATRADSTGDAVREQLGLNPGDVAWHDVRDHAGLCAVMAGARAAIVGSAHASTDEAVVTALALGIPVFCGTESGLARWVEPDAGLVVVEGGDPDGFATVVATFVANLAACTELGRAAAQRALVAFDPERVAAAYIAFCAELTRPRLHPSADSGPRLGIVMLVRHGEATTRRAVESIRRHTATPFRLVAVLAAGSDETRASLAALDNHRLSLVLLPGEPDVPAWRNAGLDALRGDEDYVVLLDDTVEVLEDWWRPFVDAHEADHHLAIATERAPHAGSPEAPADAPGKRAEDEPHDSVSGYCMVLRRASLERIGRFDERLDERWCADDLALRAARVGEHVAAVDSGRVLSFADDRDTPSDSAGWEKRGARSPAGQVRLLVSAKHSAFAAGGDRLVFLADATEAALVHEVLRCWRNSFTAEDAATLVLYGPGLDPTGYVAELTHAAAWAGLSLENGPALLAKLPPARDDALEHSLADQALGCLGRGPTGAAFTHLARLDPEDPDGLRLLAARAWAAMADPPAHSRS